MTLVVPREHYHYGEIIAKRYMKFYYFLFKKEGFELEDLVQESRITIWQIYKKFNEKPKEELKKLISKAVGYRLNTIRRNLKNNITFQPLNTNLDTDNNDINNTLLEKEDGEIEEKCLEDTISPETLPQSIDYEGTIKEYCYIQKKIKTAKLYDILLKKLKETKTLKEIAQEVGLSIQRVSVILKTVLPEIKEYFLIK